MLWYPCDGGRVVEFIIIVDDDTNGGAGNELSCATEGLESPPISGLGIPPKASLLLLLLLLLLLMIAPGGPFIIMVEPRPPIIIPPVGLLLPFVGAISCCGMVPLVRSPGGSCGDMVGFDGDTWATGTGRLAVVLG